MLSPIEEPPVRRVRWPEAHRIVPSRYPPVQLFERLSGDPAEWETLAEIESLTNPRIRDEIGEIHLVPVEDRVSGPGASWVMAPFTHVNPNGSRFSDGSYGVYYAARELPTAIAETVFHMGRFYAATADPPHAEDMRVLTGRIGTTFHDIRGGDRQLGAAARSGQLRRQPHIRPQAARRGQQRRRLSERAPRRRPVRRRLPPKGGRPAHPGPPPAVSLGRQPDQPLLRLRRGALGRRSHEADGCREALISFNRAKPASRSAIRSSGSSRPAWMRRLGNDASQAVAVR